MRISDWSSDVCSSDLEPVIFLVPRPDVEILQTWRPTGLRGTGSQDLSIELCFVPTHRIQGIRESFLGMRPGLQVNRAQLYRNHLPQLLYHVVSVLATDATRTGLVDPTYLKIPQPTH